VEGVLKQKIAVRLELLAIADASASRPWSTRFRSMSATRQMSNPSTCRTSKRYKTKRSVLPSLKSACSAQKSDALHSSSTTSSRRAWRW
jgi:hypothetical protein